MEKIKNIEFLRFLGCVAIIFFHFMQNKYLQLVTENNLFFTNALNYFEDAEKSVDLFFIISGVFFVSSFNKKSSLFDFLVRKIIKFYPVFIFVLILSYIVSFFNLCEFYLYDNVLSLFGLSGTGLALMQGNVGVFWFVSALLWSFFLLAYSLQNFNSKKVHLCLVFLIFFCYSFLIHAKDGAIDHCTLTFYNFLNEGMMRAISGIGIGYFIGYFYFNNKGNITKYMPKLNFKILFSLIEFSALWFIINHFFFTKLEYNNDLIYILAFSVLIFMFVMKKGYISQILENKLFSFIGKYTYSVFMTHMFVLSILPLSFFEFFKGFIISSPILFFLFIFTILFIVGILVYYLVEVPSKKYFLKNFVENKSKI